MHLLSPGISVLLKECLFNYLCHCFCTSPSMRYVSGEPEPYNVIQRRVSELINKFLRDTELQSPGTGLKINFSKGESKRSLSGIFTMTGVTGTLEASDYDFLEVVALCLGEMPDSYCGNC